MFLGGLGFALTKLKHIKEICLVYPSVGHTHMSVDAHFGTISKSTSGADIKDPIEFGKFLLEKIDSVGEVVPDSTIFDFTEITKLMHKPPNLCSNGFITIGRTSTGKITCASSLTMNAGELIGAERKSVSFDLFKDEFYASDFNPLITKPDYSEIEGKIKKLVKLSGGIMTAQNERNFRFFFDQYGHQSFRELICRINSVSPKVPSLSMSDGGEMHMSIIEFLKKSGISPGHIPKKPVHKE
ncbi:hypothetical protein GCK72_022881 [Caenorhabditis remanei]|uniref:Uncharacterized protein n=1 Tax=Caenorhabditis remanei TaxID=31234 RepID=A0A6A5FV81_CAERE|nr:hypothetical protein GCK72_022881 [Caenorhabditis remanei]KAF1746426.1 hypothetical protein GCK72_022881 [Caenorhabditis remanei]